MNKHTIIPGLGFLAAGAFLVVYELGWLNFHVGIWTLIFTVILAFFMIKDAIYGGIVVPVASLAILAMLYARPLGIEKLVPWTIIVVAILVIIGLELLFKTKNHRYYTFHHGHGQHQFKKKYVYGPDDVQESMDSELNLNANMTSTFRYVKAQDFQRGDVTAKMASVKLYFDKAHINTTATLNLDVNLSDVLIYVPRDWHVVNHANALLSDVEEKTAADTITTAELIITGNVNLSSVNIYHI
ncbi:hypothetical protein KAR50_00965 [Periweissella fabaria]|uniref:LiaF transmembrane domain-containing protein n=1 Tax=Periweissella fabaria TaxID=546157 RepID=A0ABM8Z519_9LACO|nr:hypothetical protein [Periweissella fabaria]MCM0596416.1 hypothetical protein [Periweissella fabaria]CAH0415856.1 hypothetical protein WFA24289_00154 [Periweissella fabaria]